MIFGNGATTFFASESFVDIWQQAKLRGLTISKTATTLTRARKQLEGVQYYLCQPQQATPKLHASSNVVYEMPAECDECQRGAEIVKIEKAIFENCLLDAVAPCSLIPWTLFSATAMRLILENELTNFAFFDGFEGDSSSTEFIKYNYLSELKGGGFETVENYIPDWFR